MKKVWEAKFFMTIGCGAVCSILVAFAKIDSTAFASIIIATVGAFIAGDTYERVKKGGDNDT